MRHCGSAGMGIRRSGRSARWEQYQHCDAERQVRQCGGVACASTPAAGSAREPAGRQWACGFVTIHTGEADVQPIETPLMSGSRRDRSSC